MPETIYWLWLQKCLGFGGNYKEILEHFHSPKALFEASDDERKKCAFLKNKRRLREKMCTTELEEVKSIIEVCKKHNIHILTPDCEGFPDNLKTIPNPPAALYVRGDASILKSEFPIAVIGSRTPCKYGEESARKIVGDLIRDTQAVIISGGALGIDSVAHSTAIEQGGKTVLVLGCGHGVDYLSQNKELRKSVYFNGALVSEYPPYTPATEDSFPKRNRIISGLSKAVVIIEAAEYSGTFSTAKHAKKQGRELFVLPGDIVSGNFAGSNALISEGAKAIFAAQDIISFFSGVKKHTSFGKIKSNSPFENIDVESEFSKRAQRKKAKNTIESSETKPVTEEVAVEIKKNTKNLPETISKNAEIVYNLMSDGKCTLDEFVNNSELLPGKVLVALTELELEGLVKKVADAYRLV